jgi:hypothetical protein
MHPLDLRTNTEKLAAAEAFQQLQRRRAAETVRARVSEPAACEELLACLDLLDLEEPVLA